MPMGEFSVFWWDRNGYQHDELRFVDAETAVRRVSHLCNGPAARVLKAVTRVIVTDGGDCCAFEWKDGEVVFDGRG